MVDLTLLLSYFAEEVGGAALRAAIAEAVAKHPERAPELVAMRRALCEQRRPDLALALLALELQQTADATRRTDLWVEQATLLEEELWDAEGAKETWTQVLGVAPDHTLAREAMAEQGLARANWAALAAKLAAEAKASTDRSLAPSLHIAAAAMLLRYGTPEVQPEAEALLRQALAPESGRDDFAWFHLQRLLTKQGRWSDLLGALQARAERVSQREPLARVLTAMAELQASQFNQSELALSTAQRALSLVPGDAAAMRCVARLWEAQGKWSELALVYQAWLRERRAVDDVAHLEILIALAEILADRLGVPARAEEYYRRVRRLQPAHPGMLAFYRQYFQGPEDSAKLISLLKLAERALADRGASESQQLRRLGVEIAEISESQLGNAEKAIEAWKQLLRQDPQSQEARTALARLYRKLERWNALIDLLKDEVDRLAPERLELKLERLFEMAEIYQDKLRLDVMVLSSYQAVLKLEPGNARAFAELSQRLRTLNRWNDLIQVLSQRAELETMAEAERVAMLQEVASLWAERFGNLGNAVRPLERVMQLTTDPGVRAEARAKLKDIYLRRRQWRGLIDLLATEEAELEGFERLHKRAEMARLAAERVGDTKLAIELTNPLVAELAAAALGSADPALLRFEYETLTSLSTLYERERRFLAAAEVYDRQLAHLVAHRPYDDGSRVALLERTANLWAEKLQAPVQAAPYWEQLLALDLHHAKAVRNLREVYLQEADAAGLERLYQRLGQPDELVEALLGLAERQGDAARKLELITQAAHLATRHIEAIGDTSERSIERLVRVWERALVVAPQYLPAARALLPYYERLQKWPRLLAMLELELAAAPDAAATSAVLRRLAEVSEQKLGSKAMAFAWALQAFDLTPHEPVALNEIERLAYDVDSWRVVAQRCEVEGLALLAQGHATQGAAMLGQAVTIARRLGDSASALRLLERLREQGDPEHRYRLEAEELMGAAANWAGVLASMRVRAESAAEPRAALQLWADMASLQEARLHDEQGAQETYERMLQAPEMPEDVRRRVLAALERLYQARGRWADLTHVLGLQLEALRLPGEIVDVRMRRGALLRDRLQDPVGAFAEFWAALQLPNERGALRYDVVQGVTPYLFEPLRALLPEATQRELARALCGYFASTTSPNAHDYAAAAEILVADPALAANERERYDRVLLMLYHHELGDMGAAWRCALRLLDAKPHDDATRSSVFALAAQLGRDGEIAQRLHQAALAACPREAALVDNPGAQVKLWLAVAAFAAHRGGQLTLAEDAWRRVLAIAPEHQAARNLLLEHLRTTTRLDALQLELQGAVEATADPTQRARIYAELAKVSEALGDRKTAIAAYRQVLALEPYDRAAFAGLAGALRAADDPTALAALLLDYVSTERGAHDAEALVELAQLRAYRLGQPREAVDAVEELWLAAPGHPAGFAVLADLLVADAAGVALAAAQLLGPAAEARGDWQQVVACMRVELAAAHAQELQVDLGLRLAAMLESKLGDARAAFAAYQQAFALQPAVVPLAPLERLANQLGEQRLWMTLLAAAAGRVAADLNLGKAKAMLVRAAELAAGPLQDRSAARSYWEAYEQLDPHDVEATKRALTQLASLHRDAAQWDLWIETTRRWLAIEGHTDAEVAATFAELAAVEEAQQGDLTAAIDAWYELRHRQPAHRPAVVALDRLLRASGRWREVVELKRGMLEWPDVDPIAQLHEIATLFEAELNSPAEALATYSELVARDPRQRVAWEALARLYRAEARSADEFDAVAQLSPLVDQHERHALDVRLAQLLSGDLARPDEALTRWQRVLAEAPEHPEALAFVRQCFDDPELRVRAGRVYVQWLERRAQHSELADFYEQTVAWAETPDAAQATLAKVVALREATGNLPAAMQAQIQILRLTAASPQLGTALREFERLCEAAQQPEALIVTYQEVLPEVADAAIVRQMHLDIADLSRGLRKDYGTAISHYRAVLVATPDDRRAMAALESVYREQGDLEALCQLLLTQAETTGLAADEQVAVLAEAAEFMEQRGNPHDAILTWERILELEPLNAAAFAALERLYREHARWHDLLEFYERRLGVTPTVAEAVRLRVQLAVVNEHELSDKSQAIVHYAAALRNDHEQADAFAALSRLAQDPTVRLDAAAALEPVLVAQHRWHELAAIYRVRLEAALDDATKVRAMYDLARICEEQLEDFEQASRWYGLIFVDDPTREDASDHLMRIAGVLGGWHFVIEAYEAALGQAHGDCLTRSLAVTLGAVYERQPAAVTQALACYRRALSLSGDGTPPTDAQLLERVESLAGAHALWRELDALYAALATHDDAALRRGVLAKRADIAETKLAQLESAITSWQALADELADDAEGSQWEVVANELERLYRRTSRWHDLVGLFERWLDRAPTPEAERAVRLRLAEVVEYQLGDYEQALDHYSTLIAGTEGWERGVAALERLVVQPTIQEHVIRVLEPVYRREQWWHRLAVILDAKLAYLHDDVERRETLLEIAALHYDRGGDHRLARNARQRAWELDPSDGVTFELLLESARLDRAWPEVLPAVTKRAKLAEPEVAVRLWARLAAIYELELGDDASAVTAWQEVLSREPQHEAALEALDNLLVRHQRLAEALPIILRRAEHGADEASRIALYHRAGAYAEGALGNLGAAIEAYREAVHVVPGDRHALEALERLFTKTGRHLDRIEILERQLELPQAVDERRRVQRALALAYEVHGHDEVQAIAYHRANVEADAHDLESLQDLVRLYGVQRNWHDQAAMLDALAAAQPAPIRRQTMLQAAELVARELGDIDDAISRYAAVLNMEGDQAEAKRALFELLQGDDHVEACAAALEPQCRAEHDAEGLARILERRLATVALDEPNTRRLLWAQLADVHEVMGGSPERAFEIWRRAFLELPHEVETRAPLLRLAEACGRWPDVAALFQHALDQTGAPPDDGLAMRLGEIYEYKLRDLAGARAAYGRAEQWSDENSTRSMALLALERVVTQLQDFEGLVEVISRQADLAEGVELRAECRYRVGAVLERDLRRAAEACDAYQAALEEWDGHRGAQHALHGLALNSTLAANLRHRAAEAAVELWTNQGDALKQIEALRVLFVLAPSETPPWRELGERMVALYEDGLSDIGSALDMALRLHSAHPGDEELLGNVVRLAARNGAWADVATALGEAAQAMPAGTDRHAAAALWGTVGQLRADKLGWLPQAIAAYREAAACMPDELSHVDALVGLYRRTNDTEGLAAALTRRAELTLDAGIATAALHEVASLYTLAGNDDAALRAWDEILRHEPGQHDALSGKLALYEKRGDAARVLACLIELVEHTVDQPGQHRGYRERLARHHEQTGALSDAAAQWQHLVDADANPDTARAELERVLGLAQDWEALRGSLSARLDAAALPEARLPILMQLGELCETRLHDIDAAMPYWEEVLHQAPAQGQAYEALARMLRQGQRWHDLIDLITRQAEQSAMAGDGRAEQLALAQVADIWEQELHDAEAASGVLERMLRLDPRSVVALTRLSKMYERQGDTAKCLRVLEQALALGPVGDEAAELHFRMAEIARGRGDHTLQLEHLAHARRFAPGHVEATSALEALARAAQDHETLERLLLERVPRCDRLTPTAQVELWLELVSLAELQGRRNAARERAEQLRPWLAVLDPGLRLRVAEAWASCGLTTDAQPLFDALAQAAKSERRLKDVAAIRVRQAQLLKQAGDTAGALTALDEAYRLQPTDVRVVAELAAMALGERNWELARRLYQALVLQTIPAELVASHGLGKAELYLALGLALQGLGQLDKAKAMWLRGLEFVPTHEALRMALARHEGA